MNSCYKTKSYLVVKDHQAFHPGPALDEAVSESEGGTGEGVCDGRVDAGVVPVVVAVGVEGELEDVEDARAQDDGQPLVVGDVLEHGAHYLPPLLK